MKARTFFRGLALLLLVQTLSLSAQACAICGCGAGGYYMGLMPLYAKNFAGLRYRSLTYTNRSLTDPPAFADLNKSTDRFETVEAWGRLYLTPRLQAMAYLPYQFHQHTDHTGTKATTGIGDALAFLNYNVFNNLGDTSAPAIRHSLWVGAGVKAATGAYKGVEPGQTSIANPTVMLGTGSWDPMLLIGYQIRRNRTGLSLDMTGRLATPNRQGYTFGNRATASLTAFTIRQRQGWGYMPSLGLYAETTGQDYRTKGGYYVPQTGGNLLAAQAGLDILVRAWTIGALVQQPWSQHLADGAQRSGTRLMLQIGKAF